MRYKPSAPATLHTTIQLPASKSISNRALILHALAQGHIAPSNLSDCDDTRVMIKALDGNPGHIDILAAGTAMRFLTAYLSVTPGTRIITGTERMQQRPIRILVDALRELGAQIEYAGKEGTMMLENYRKYKFDCLVILGGNGTHKTANLLAQHGVNVVSLPKTIDNDLWGTDMTFGFQSAVDIATHVIDCIHTTATSHGRVFIVEVMGHKVGWLTLYAGISGGADVILIPELPYDVDKVCKVLKKRKMQGKPFSILAVAEGAISKEESKLSKKEFKAARAQMKEPSVSYRLANEIAERTGQEIRVTIPGHFQRGGSPCAYDRVLSTRFGTAAAELIAQKKFGYMVAIRNNLIVPVPLSEVAGKLKTVSPDCDEIRAARDMGISLGD